MSPTEFRFRLELLGLTVRRFATMTGVDCELARGWGSTQPDSEPFPDWVEATIAAWERNGVPK